MMWFDEALAKLIETPRDWSNEEQRHGHYKHLDSDSLEGYPTDITLMFNTNHHDQIVCIEFVVSSIVLRARCHVMDIGPMVQRLREVARPQLATTGMEPGISQVS